jgi:hypothetical protein
LMNFGARYQVRSVETSIDQRLVYHLANGMQMRSTDCTFKDDVPERTEHGASLA